MKTCAVILDTNGNCLYVAEIRNVNDKQYQDLVLEQIKHEEEEKKHKEELEYKLNELFAKVKELEQEIKILKGEE